MTNQMEYKGYVGEVEFDADARLFSGRVIDTKDVITFQGTSVDELSQAFRDSVDDYLEFCHERGEEANKPFSGQFVTRVTPELHRLISLAASVSGKSLNAWVSEQLQRAVADFGEAKKKEAQKNAQASVGHKRKKTKKTPSFPS